MNYNDMVYERPDINKYKDIQLKIIDDIKNTLDINIIKELINTYTNNYIDISSSMSLAFIRNSINTLDKYYEDEVNFCLEIEPLLDDVTNTFNDVLLNHSKRKEIEDIYGTYYFTKLEIEKNCFSSSIIDLLVTESKLANKYDTLIAGAQIEFEGKIYNLQQMGKFSQNTDREIRKNAAIAVDKFMSSNDTNIGDIYLELVKVRTEIANKLGYKTFTELGYLRMLRTDYTPVEVSNFRELIVKYIVPIANKIVDKQAKRINITNPKMYDLSLEYLDGNATPKGNKDELVAKALEMYSDMSEETKEFFSFMVTNNLMDLESKAGKMAGGYCSSIDKYKAPFIFSNFNGTSGDVDVLTHEAGHAFQYYYSNKYITNPFLINPTLDACEIHSMSMEFFAYPYLELFFKEDTKKYKESHLSDTMKFLPYACCVDHFQHIVYENPNLSIAEIKETWSKLEKLYLPWRDYGECSFTASGTFWYKQGHIFSSPFYYIDYALAQICALTFHLLNLKDHKKAWEKYLDLCRLGGTKPILKLLETINFPNPFEEDTLKNIAKEISNKLEDIDD